MVTLESAENALKEVYLGVVANQLNVAANPLLAQIKHSSNNIFGKEIKKVAPVGINGGVGATSEDGALPVVAKQNYVEFVSTLKNLYGRFEITDKAVRATANSVSGFVNLLNDEMESLIKASNFNLGRMLFGTGSGCLATITAMDADNKNVTVDSTRNLVEGMVVYFYTEEDELASTATPFTITYVDRVENKVYTDAGNYTSSSVGYGSKIYNQKSINQEITGIEGLFTNETLYGLKKSDYAWLKPYENAELSYLSENLIQTVIDYLEENRDSNVNYIATTKSIRRLFQEYLGAYRRNIDVAELNGGFKTIAYNGIPVVGDRFVPEKTMYLLNTNDFTMYEMGDWNWLSDENGRILKQIPGYAAYTATLVKYAELICDKPGGQGKISNIADTLTAAE